ncbi:MAG: hypothetical protein ABI142_10345, partial [Bryocella sp.]
MRGTSPDANCLMAELLWVLMLFQSNVGAAKKRESIELVWSWSGESLGVDHSLLTDEVLLGIGNSGPRYIRHRDLELGLLIGLGLDLTRQPQAERAALLSDRERFERWLVDIPQEGYRQFRHMFRYLAFPDFNERITQNRDRVLILGAYNGTDSKAIRAISDAQQDDALRNLREKLAVEHGTEDLDFYATPLV